MFERYTEKARRIIFFGRYEASQFGSPYIETEHLLLGLLREDKALANRFLRLHGRRVVLEPGRGTRALFRNIGSFTAGLGSGSPTSAVWA